MNNFEQFYLLDTNVRLAPDEEAAMATICTIEENGKAVAVVSMFENLLMPGALAPALNQGKWLWSALRAKPAPWDGKSPITARASTLIELGLYESNVQEALKVGDVNKDHHMAALYVEPAEKQSIEIETGRNA